MNLPHHGRRTCIGLELHGVVEPCDAFVEDNSPFPFCAYHRAQIETMPRRRTCSGAIVYDAAMRPQRTECHNATGALDVALCAHCRVVEKREKERFRAASQDVCPTCGRSGPRPRQPLSLPPRRYKPQAERATSEPQRYNFNAGIPPYKDEDE